MSAEIVSAAKYAVQQYRRLKRAEEVAGENHVTSSELETAKRAVRHGQTLFACAMEELCAEFPEEGS